MVSLRIWFCQGHGIKEEAIKRAWHCKKTCGVFDQGEQKSVSSATVTSLSLKNFVWALLWENWLFAYAKTKTQISFAVTTKLISAFVFATLIVQYLYFFNVKFQASSHHFWLYSPVCLGPGRKPWRPVFSQQGLYIIMLSRQPTTKVLIRLCGWSAHPHSLISTYVICICMKQVFSWHCSDSVFQWQEEDNGI